MIFSFIFNFSIVPSGCADVVLSNNDITAQNAEKQSAGDKPTVAEKPEVVEKSKLLNTSYIFTRYSLKKWVSSNHRWPFLVHSTIFNRFDSIFRPAVVIPSPDHFTIAVRCCPLFFELRPHDANKPPLIDLPYRMVYAVASKSSVYLYDTQQKMPFGCVSNIHYARLTDLTWSSDGNILIVSSVDGFCTVITFEGGELGKVYDKPLPNYELDDKENPTKSKRTSPKSGVKRKTNNEKRDGRNIQNWTN